MTDPSARLRDYLESLKPQRLTGQAALKVLSFMWHDNPQPIDPSLAPERAILTWRAVRALAAMRGIMDRAEPLEDVLPAGAPAWTDDHGLAKLPGGSSAVTIRQLAVLDDLGPLPLLCPAHPEVAPAWCRAFAAAAGYLRMASSGAGKAVLEEFLDPATAPYACAGPETLLCLEAAVLDAAQGLLIKGGDEQAVVTHFRLPPWDLTRQEALAICRMARRRLTELHSGDMEEYRAMLVSLWMDHIRRAKEEPVGLVHEARAYKELAKVLGVTRTEPQDDQAEFVKIVRTVASQAPQLSAPHRTIDMPRLAQGTPPGYDPDEAALAEFDLDD